MLICRASRSRRIEVWHDRKIPPGSNWRAEIDRELDSADIILLLVSANFMSSDFCHAVELQRAIARHQSGAALVIPIMLRPCDVKGTVIETLQQLPEGGRPITKWGNRDEACQDVAHRLRIAVDEWKSFVDTAQPAAPGSSATVEPHAQQAAVLTKIFGLGQAVNVAWLPALQRRGSAVARIKSRSPPGDGIGTGFLVDPAIFGLAQTAAPLLLSVSYVIDRSAGSSEAVMRGSLRPDDVIAEFQLAGVERCVREILWWSPVRELRSVLVSLDGPVEAEPIPLGPRPEDPITHAQDRVVVIGHAHGGELQFSIGENHLLDLDETRLHYRAATAPGSSGSPVLSASNLEVLGIHSAKSFQMPRLHGEGTYEACEGISLHAIQGATRALRS